ncbi:unnamed protein product [Rotaria magnacalcarata]
MADGVQNAAVICCFMTPDYQISENCEKELQCAADSKIRIIPCMLGDQNNTEWKPSGWLKLVTAGLNYVKIRDHSDLNIRLKAKELIGRIKNQYLPPAEERAPAPPKFFESIREKYLRENRIKRIVNEEKSFPIEQSYINLAMIETKEQQEKEKKLKEQDKHGRPDRENDQDNRRPYQHNEILGTYEEIYGTKTSINVEEIFQKCKGANKKVLVLGRAGIGKSTFCQYVTYRWAKHDLWSEYELLVLIHLRKLTVSRYPQGKEYSPSDIMKKEYFPYDDISREERQYFNEQCKNGKVLWILDGYDEFAQNIPAQLEDSFQHVRETQHHILTSRPYPIDFSYDANMEIIGFTDDNIHKYVEQFFNQIECEKQNAPPESSKAIKFIQSNPSVWGVAHIPVNLELICTAWSNTDWSKTTMLTVSVLYDNIIEWLCRRYLTKQNIKQIDMFKPAVYKQCNAPLQFLEHLAFKAMKQNKIMLPPELLEETQQDCPLDHFQEISNFGILKSYDDKLAGASNETKKQYYFVHLSFQEHFAARHLLKLLGGSNKQEAINFINNYKYDQRLRLVFIFATGLLAQSTFQSVRKVFITTLDGETFDLVGLQHTKLLIECIDQLIDHTVFPERTAYLKTITQWIVISAAQKPRIIQDHLLQSLQRAINLTNAEIIQNTLMKLLQSTQATTKDRISYIIVNLEIPKPIPRYLTAICAAMGDEDEDVREWACEVFGKIGKEAATIEMITALVNAMRDGNDHARMGACEAFGKMGEKAATNEVIVALVNSMHDGEKYVRLGACKALGNMGEKAATTEVIAALVNSTHDEEKYVRLGACKTLGKMGEKTKTNEVIVALVNGMRDEEKYVRSGASEALGKMGEKTKTNEVIAALVNAMRAEDYDVRSGVCEALVRIGEKAATNKVIAALVNAMRDDYWRVRSEACDALGKMGEKAATTEVIAALVNSMRDEGEVVRRMASEALGKMGEKAATTEVIAALVNGMRDGDEYVPMMACEALERLGKKGATNGVIAAIVNAIRDGDEVVRRMPYEGLGNFGEKAATTEVIAALVNAMRDGNKYVRRWACQALEKMGEKGATNEVIVALMNAMRDEYEVVRRISYGALGKMGEKAATNEVIAALVNAMRDGDKNVRGISYEALGKMGEKAATTEVIAALVNGMRDEDGWIRSVACEALGNIGEKAATNEVIAALVDVCGATLVDDEYKLHKSLSVALCSYNGLRNLDLHMIEKLTFCVKEWELMDLTSMPAAQLFKIYRETENDAWLPLIVRGSLLQGIAVTVDGNTVRIYHGGGVVLVDMFKDRLRESLVKAFENQIQELESHCMEQWKSGRSGTKATSFVDVF